MHAAVVAPLVQPESPPAIPLITVEGVLARWGTTRKFSPEEIATVRVEILPAIVAEVDALIHSGLHHAELDELDHRLAMASTTEDARLLIHQPYEHRTAHQQLLLRMAALDAAQGMLALRYPSLLPGVDGDKLLKFASAVVGEVGRSITVSFPESFTESTIPPAPALRPGLQVDVEWLARELHEGGRVAVAAGLVVNKVQGQPFIEWDEIPEEARAGRRSQAEHLLAKFTITLRG